MGVDEILGPVIKTKKMYKEKKHTSFEKPLFQGISFVPRTKLFLQDGLVAHRQPLRRGAWDSGFAKPFNTICFPRGNKNFYNFKIYINILTEKNML